MTACAICNHTIQSKHRNAIYCSRGCLHTALRASRVKVVCAHCGCDFETAPSRDQTYCSIKCRHDAGVSLRTLTCSGCGCVFVRSHGQPARRFCTHACATSSSAKPRITLAPDPIAGCCWIPLTDGEFALIDESDYKRVAAHVWLASSPVGGLRYPTAKIGGSPVKLHVFLLGGRADHVNGDSLNNRRSNIRLATQLQNSWNRRRPTNNTSGYKGVTTFKRGPRPWHAKIGVRGKRYHLGLFATPEEAAVAYDVAAKEHFGVFARLNFPETS